MPHPLLNDWQERVMVEDKPGHSHHKAAARFDTSLSFPAILPKSWDIRPILVTSRSRSVLVSAALPTWLWYLPGRTPTT